MQLLMMTTLKLSKNNPGHVMWHIADILHISHMSVVKLLKTLGYVNSYDVWRFHDLTENICDSLLNINKMNHF